MEADDPLWQEFAAETAEHLDALEQGLAGQTPVDVLFRAMHSLKGMSSAIGATGLGALAHKAEDVLGLARAGRLALDSAARNALLEAVDALRSQRSALLDRHQDQQPPAALLARLGALADGRPETTPLAPIVAASTLDPLRITLASRLAIELPLVAVDPREAGRLAQAARDAKLPRLARLFDALPIAPHRLAALGRLRRALMLLQAATGGDPVPPLTGDLRPAAEFLAMALDTPGPELVAAAERLAASADAVGDEPAETLARQIQDLACRQGEEPAARLAELSPAFRAALATPELAPLADRVRPPPPPLTPSLAAA
ncbi:MAG: hypothetical protein JWR10_4119, partial [Rubritepida sp.]|nr:hypothetical protein [Rubritepida sp.]